ncbi:MAG: glycosyltransferase [Candidatus Pacebacteria bacterium]|nr:glycosyltransferase [Candidatus Paceibacterota bacterium]
MGIKVSIIMSVYNGENFLNESIQSILNQVFKDFEFIIINDCSTDSSLNIIKKYAKKDKRVIIIENKKNLGLTKSLNKGLELAKGKYIARQDADDVASPRRLEKQYNFLEKNEDVFLVGSGAINIDEKGNVLNTRKAIADPNKIALELPKNNCIYHSSIMYRNNGQYLYREKFPYSQDYDLYLRILSDGEQIASLEEPLIKYRINSGAISWTKRAQQMMFAEKARDFYFQRLRYGKDEYDNFDPNEILNIDVEKSTNEAILEAEIKASFRINNFKKTRELCKKYFKYHGYLNKALLYYLLSFFNKSFINLVRRVIFS